jgi:hypothetical protein
MRLRSSKWKRHDALPFRVHATPLAIVRLLLLALLFLPLLDAAPVFAQDNLQIHWKAVDMAQVRVDGKTPLKWNVYQPDKKDKKDKKRDSDLILILLGHRYLVVDAKAREVYVVPLASLRAQGPDFDSTGDLEQDANMIPTTDWTSHDVGPAQLYKLTLGDYNHVMEVSIPHPPDLRAFY